MSEDVSNKSIEEAAKLASPIETQEVAPEVRDLIEFEKYITIKIKEQLDDPANKGGKIDVKKLMWSLMDDPMVTFDAVWGLWNLPNDIKEMMANPDEGIEIITDMVKSTLALITILLTK